MKALSETTVLALHAMRLMLRNSTPVSLGEISRSGHFAPTQVRAVLRKLRAAGLIRSRSGHGHLLTKAPGEISILDVVATVDLPQSPSAPCGGDYDACATRATCFMAPLCRSAEQNFQEALRKFTLSDFGDVSVELPNCLDPSLRTLAS